MNKVRILARNYYLEKYGANAVIRTLRIFLRSICSSSFQKLVLIDCYIMYIKRKVVFDPI